MFENKMLGVYFLCGVSMLALSPMSSVYANPAGGVISGGAATITSNANKLDIHQQTNRAVIDWRSFDIDVGEHTEFHQPSSSAIALNRVNSVDPSQIMGKLSANGNVVLINPNGLFFGASSRIDVNGLLATTVDIDTDDFMNGSMHFNKPGKSGAGIINQGLITAKEAGLVGLVAPNVINSGIIEAKYGQVHLSSADSMVVDFYGDGLYQLKVSDAVKSQIVQNTGTLISEGGVIAITAASGKDIVNSLIHIEGEVLAPTITQKEGRIIIAAAGSNAVEGNITASKGVKNGKSTVVLSKAYIDASGDETGEKGGVVEITADQIFLTDNSVLNTNGHSVENYNEAAIGTATMTASKEVRSADEFLAHENRVGGSIKIGGDYLGKGDTAAAEYVYVSHDSYIINDTIQSGDAGRTIVWADNTTEFSGNVFARGGLKGGHGGFLETSGKINLLAGGYADLQAKSGFKQGTYLLDPSVINIYGNIDSAFTTSNLINHWDFEEGSGATVTDQIGSDDGAITGAVYNADTPSILMPTSNDYSLDFSNDTVNFGDINAIELAPVTVSFWAKSDTTNADQGFLYKGIHSTNQPLLIWRDNAVGSGQQAGNSNAISVLVYDGATQDWVSTPTNSFNDTDWHHVAATLDPVTNNQIEIFIDGVSMQTGAMASNGIRANANNLTMGKATSGGTGLTGHMDDMRIYNTVLDAKNIEELSGNAFTVKGLELMSQTADIILQADNTINLDFDGEQLDLANDKSITLQTINGNITDNSAGTIRTNRTGAGGNITMTAGGSGSINLDTTNLEALSGGVVNLSAGGNVNLKQVSALNLNSVTGNTVTIQTTGSTADITLNNTITASNSGNAIIMASGDDFINNVGATVLNTTDMNGRWLVYSETPTANTRNSLLPDSSDYGFTYATLAPGAVTAGNHFIYSNATRPTLTYTVNDSSLEYGDTYGGSSISSVSGLLTGDTLANIGLTGSNFFTTTYTAGDNAGVHSNVLTSTAGTLANQLGYSYAFNAGDLTVNKADLTVTLIDNAPTKVEGNVNPIFDLSYTGFKLADNASVVDTINVTTLADTSSGAGVYNIDIAGSDNNYNLLITNPSGKLTVTAKPASSIPTKAQISAKPTISVINTATNKSINNSNINVQYNGANNLYEEATILDGLINIHPRVAALFKLKGADTQVTTGDSRWKRDTVLRGLE
tara:strand:- start:131504 stop:135076 length:3573 start_codon:yes stop_codon:yes gene_type:complete